ncbi:MAG: PAS domain-containing protein [Pedobacter sp.]|nr:MAG: PAS domain-containing protein [Pedobacter sp.]
MIIDEILPYKELFDNSPIAAAILDARTLKLEVANEGMLNLWGRDKSVINTGILDFMPEIADQEYPKYMKDVAKTGNKRQEEGALVMLKKNGVLQRLYMDYSYIPIFGSRATPLAILITGTEISAKQLHMMAGDEYKRNLRAMVMSAPVPMCVFKGNNFTLESVNNYMLDLWQDKQQRNIDALKYVFYTGMPLEFEEGHINYSCTALRDEYGNSTGCVLIASSKKN